jgi:DNA ligase (NAD+)
VTRLPSAESAAGWYGEIRDRRNDLPYEIDGCVFKVNNLADQEKMGTRSSNPRWAVAWKFPSRQATTTIRNILASVGRTGAVTPVAELEPVHIGGVEVSHVSLHNQDEIDRKDIRIGDHVLVERAGDVIPHVVRVIKDNRTGNEKKYHLPRQCPVCSGEIVKPEGEAISRCVNSSCPAQLKQGLIHFGSKEALDIDGLGEHLADELVETGMVKNAADLFHLKTEDLRQLERVAEKSAKNLVEAIGRAKKKATLARLIYALGIPHVGRTVADQLSAEFQKIDELAAADRDRLTAIEGIGDTMASAVVVWFANDRNRNLLEQLKQAGVDPGAQRRGSRLEGKTLVITGSLESMTRDEAKEAIRSQGGSATSSVSAHTDYLVVGADPGQRKRSDAEAHGVETIDEEAFLKLIGRK